MYDQIEETEFEIVEPDSSECTLATIPQKIVDIDPVKTKALIDLIRKEAKSIVADPKTEDGRKELKRVAGLVSSSKTHLAKLLKKKVEDISIMVNTYTKARTGMEKDLDALRDEVKQPALDEEERIQKAQNLIKDRIIEIQKLGENFSQLTSVEIEERQNKISELASDFDFKEFESLSSETFMNSFTNLEKALTQRISYEEELKDLEEFRETKRKKDEEEKRIQDEKDKEILDAKIKADEAEKIRKAVEKALEDEKEKVRLENVRLENIQKEENKKKEKLLADESYRTQIFEAAVSSLNSIVPNKSLASKIVVAIRNGEIKNISLNF